MSIRVHAPGLLTTVQDLGRFGCAHLGVSPTGAADALSLRIANRLVGNPENAPALEMTLVGPKLTFEQDHTIAFAGATLAHPMLQPVTVSAGTTLEIGPLTKGARTYMAVRGGFDVGRVLGSASTHLSARFGGYGGRALAKDDVLRVATAFEARVARKAVAPLRSFFEFDGVIRATASTQWEWFDLPARVRLHSAPYSVSEHSNRSGLRLTGAAIKANTDAELLTEGVSLGAVQVPRDGQPIILFVDQQTTGGYPKIVNVISADLHHVAQLRPRDVIRFKLISIEEAVAALRAQEDQLNEVLPL